MILLLTLWVRRQLIRYGFGKSGDETCRWGACGVDAVARAGRRRCFGKEHRARGLADGPRGMGECRGQCNSRDPTRATPRAIRDHVLVGGVGGSRRGIRGPDGWEESATGELEVRVPEIAARDTEQHQRERQCEPSRYHLAYGLVPHGGHPDGSPIDKTNHSLEWPQGKRMDLGAALHRVRRTGAVRASTVNPSYFVEPASG